MEFTLNLIEGITSDVKQHLPNVDLNNHPSKDEILKKLEEAYQAIATVYAWL